MSISNSALPAIVVTRFDEDQPPLSPKPSVSTEPIREDLRWMRVEEFLRLKALAPNSQRAYERDLKRFWQWTDKPWNEMTTRNVDRYKIHLEGLMIPDPQTGALKRQLSAESVAAAIRTLKSFFGWLKKADYITENPLLAVSIPKPKTPESKELTDFQVKALYGALSQRGKTQVRDTALLAVLSHGLRAEEASLLDIGDYDGIRVHIRQAKHDSIGKVPLNQAARAAIAAYLTWRKDRGDLLTPEAPLFLNYSRNPKVRGRLSYDGIYGMVKSLGRLAVTIAVEAATGRSLQEVITEFVTSHPALTANLAPKQILQQAAVEVVGAEMAILLDVHPHQLRHTFGTNLVLGGMDAYLAMALMRQKSIAIYHRYTSKARERQAERAFFQMLGEPEPDAAE